MTAMRCYFHEYVSEFYAHSFYMYADDSKTEVGVGCSAVGLLGSLSMKLLTTSSVSTAKLCEILCALQIARSAHPSSYVVFCDSQSAFQAVDHHESIHPLIAKIVKWLVLLHCEHKTAGLLVPFSCWDYWQ